MNLFIFYDFECYNDLCEIKERKREFALVSGNSSLIKWARHRSCSRRRQELLFTAITRSKARIDRCNRKRLPIVRGFIRKLALVDH